MHITIHRGANQIGGCVTEISTAKTRLFIDLGADLTQDNEKSISKINIDGLTTGNAKNSTLLLTHYHSDHTGRLTQALPDIPIYMGETAKKIHLIVSKRLMKYQKRNKEEIEFLEKAKTFEPGEKLKFGDITVTAYMIDHSAFDAYGFFIEADGKRIYYTGDFRLHGPKGKEKFYRIIKNIDYLICEGTNILKPQKAQKEIELKKEAMELFKNPKNKYIFILCSSTNIDRIFEFYHAYNEIFKGKRPFICDGYQKEILQIVSENHGKKTPFYNFKASEANLKNGFCLLIRHNAKAKEKLEKYFSKAPDECLLIYSMWSGYIKKNNNARNEKLIEFIEPYKNNLKELHTSGHADIESLKKIVEIIKPKHIIPIHTENPEEFTNFFENTKLLENGVPFSTCT